MGGQAREVPHAEIQTVEIVPLWSIQRFMNSNQQGVGTMNFVSIEIQSRGGVRFAGRQRKQSAEPTC